MVAERKPDIAPEGHEEPKRGPGRPPKGGTAERTKTGQFVPKDPKTRQERFSRLADIKAWVSSANAAIGIWPAAQPDMLIEPEIQQLSSAFDAWQASSPRVHRWVENALEASPAVAFLVIAIGIALPRLQRHGLIPSLGPTQPEPSPALQHNPMAASTEVQRDGVYNQARDGIAVGAPEL